MPSRRVERHRIPSERRNRTWIDTPGTGRHDLDHTLLSPSLDARPTMRIVLIDVPFDSEDIGGKSKQFTGVENTIPALGVAYLAAVAEREGHDVVILEGVLGLTRDEIARHIRSIQPHLIGLTATTPALPNAVLTARTAREMAPDAMIIVGGSHPTAQPAETISIGVFDVLVQGEGETAFQMILEHLSGQGPTLEDIPGAVFLRDGEPHFGKCATFIQDLDTIPLPARHLLAPLEAYNPCPASVRQLPQAHLMSSRGCPTNCHFCDRSVFGKKYRVRSVENVMSEVDQLVARYGAKEIRFFDDTFTLNKKRLYALCKEMRLFRPRLPWTCLTKVNCVDIDMLKMMRDSWCWQVLFGLESGDSAVLKSLNKLTTVEMCRKAVRNARAAGLRVRADFLVGSPGETPESLEKTLEFAKELDIDFAHFNKFVPFPGTTFYEQLMEEGYRFDVSSSSTLDHDALVYVPRALDPEHYRRWLDRSYREFYFRPDYLFRRLKSLRTFTEVRVNARGTLAMAAF